MQDQMGRRGTPALTVVLITVLVALVFAGGSYYYLNNKAEKEKTDLNNQITNLQKEVATLKAATTTTTTTTAETTTTSDETADWKTYTNSKYGYSIKYPANFSAKEISVAMLNIKEGSTTDAPLVVAISEDLAATGLDISQSLDDIVAKMLKENTDQGKTADYGKTTLDSVAAYELVAKGTDNNNYSLLAKSKGHLYMLSFENLSATTGTSYSVPDAKSQLTVIEKLMISTFQFSK